MNVKPLMIVSKSVQVHAATYPLTAVTQWTIVIAENTAINALIFPIISKYLAWSNLGMVFVTTSALIQLEGLIQTQEFSR